MLRTTKIYVNFLTVAGGSLSRIGPLHYEPTILTGITPEMSIFREEIFGPVLGVTKFSSEEEALRLANDTNMGLASYFYSSDLRCALCV